MSACPPVRPDRGASASEAPALIRVYVMRPAARRSVRQRSEALPWTTPGEGTLASHFRSSGRVCGPARRCVRASLMVGAKRRRRARRSPALQPPGRAHPPPVDHGRCAPAGTTTPWASRCVVGSAKPKGGAPNPPWSPNAAIVWPDRRSPALCFVARSGSNGESQGTIPRGQERWRAATVPAWFVRLASGPARALSQMSKTALRIP